MYLQHKVEPPRQSNINPSQRSAELLMVCTKHGLNTATITMKEAPVVFAVLFKALSLTLTIPPLSCYCTDDN